MHSMKYLLNRKTISRGEYFCLQILSWSLVVVFLSCLLFLWLLVVFSKTCSWYNGLLILVIIAFTIPEEEFVRNLFRTYTTYKQQQSEYDKLMNVTGINCLMGHVDGFTDPDRQLLRSQIIVGLAGFVMLLSIWGGMVLVITWDSIYTNKFVFALFLCGMLGILNTVAIFRLRKQAWYWMMVDLIMLLSISLCALFQINAGPMFSLPRVSLLILAMLASATLLLFGRNMPTDKG